MSEALEDLVERTEALYGRRFKEGEHATQLEDCQASLQQIVKELDDAHPSGSANSAAGPAVRGKAAYIRGMSVAMLEGFASPKAKALLIAAVKLAPRIPGPWNCLAHCHWTSGELELAHQCFERGLAGEVNKEGLRQRSILRRHAASLDAAGKDDDNQTSRLSIKDARQAVQLDCEDGYSWYVLGTAHLMASFKNRNPTDLRQALAGYAQAEKLGVTLPDLFYNRAILQQYQQRHQQAIADFRRAAELDEELPSLAQMQASMSLLKDLRRSVGAMRNLPERKLAAAAHALQKGMEGPEHRPEGFPVAEPLGGLREGPNDGSALVCRAMLPIDAGASSASAVHFVAMDESKQVFAVVVLGLQPGAILQGHNLLLLNPEVETVEIQGFAFCIARVSDPAKVWVDGTMSFRPTSADPTVAISASYAGA